MNNQLSALLKPAGSARTPDGDRTSTSGQAVHSPARDWRTRFASALPWVMILGFLGLLTAVLGNRLLPARELEVATVVTVRQSADSQSAQRTETKAETENVDPAAAETAAFEAQMLFQASGWVEPDPYSIKATALLDGVIEKVEVLEGDKVKEGQLLASLIDDDARLDLETAKSKLSALKAQAAGHHRQIAIVHAQTASLAKQVAVARARRDESADLVERLQRVSKGGVSEREVAKSRLELATLEAEVEAMVVTEAELEAKIEQLKEIQADFAARIVEATTEVARKQLALDRTRIESPINGRVLRLLAAPGQKKMLGMDSPDSATIAILYDPEKLQARIDVPLAEAAQLAIGQPVRLRSELLPGKTFRGRVTRIVGEADLQRNTLQAKVEIQSPDDRLRPEMLCRAEFLALPASNTPGSKDKENSPAGQMPTSLSSSGSRVQIFVPAAAINGDIVWKVDASGDHIEPQSISPGREVREDHQLVLSGLKPGDRVVINPPADLKSGDRFRPAESSPSKS